MLGRGSRSMGDYDGLLYVQRHEAEAIGIYNSYFVEEPDQYIEGGKVLNAINVILETMTAEDKRAKIVKRVNGEWKVEYECFYNNLFDYAKNVLKSKHFK